MEEGDTYMKKLVLVLFLATVLAGGVFAQSGISAGIGGTFTADFLRVNWTKNFLDTIPPGSGFEKNTYDQNILGGSFFVYVDATYVMFSLGMGFYDISPVNSTLKAFYDLFKIKQSLTTFDIGVFGKYPISLGFMSLFPLLGVDFKLALAQDTIVDGERSADYSLIDAVSPGGTIGEYWSTVWFKLGVGADIPIGDKLYIRPMILYGLGTTPKVLQKQIDAARVGSVRAGDVFSHGIDVKVAVGYKF